MSELHRDQQIADLLESMQQQAKTNEQLANALARLEVLFTADMERREIERNEAAQKEIANREQLQRMLAGYYYSLTRSIALIISGVLAGVAAGYLFVSFVEGMPFHTSNPDDTVARHLSTLYLRLGSWFVFGFVGATISCWIISAYYGRRHSSMKDDEGTENGK
jgi:hypothetical protein